MEVKKCQCCKKNQAVRSYEGDKSNAKREFYCLECYSKLFLDGIDGESLTSCPYCGTTLAEAKASKIVGCAHCYRAMSEGLVPLVQKMQGSRAHQGKTPPMDSEFGSLVDFSSGMSEEARALAVAKTRYQRQCRELEIIIEKLTAEGNVEGAKSYKEKLSTMQSQERIEEDFVWRT